jgi:hypothetical protein
MRGRIPILAALTAAAVVLVLALVLDTDGDSAQGDDDAEAAAGIPRVEIISPRNGARQASHAVVVKVRVENFKLAPADFGGEPALGRGHIRFSLNRVPDCVDPVKLERALNSAIGKGRLVGASFDYSRYSGPNGVLAEQLDVAGSYSPATRPEIFYRGLPPGFYRLVVALARNNGSTTPYHAVTNFQIFPKPGHKRKKCKEGKISSAAAAERGLR